ncbi:hypothetical protein IAF28_19835, partial [Acinetobacter baumannii]|uniref:hypothetical protein n=1 Tax=Acinetobacter baumannii TaxID=470 RepID=UPI00165FF5A7
YHEQAIAKDIQVVYDINPSTLFKSRKHESEIAHIRHAMVKDGRRGQEEQSFVNHNKRGLKSSQANKHGFEKPVKKQVYDVEIG